MQLDLKNYQNRHSLKSKIGRVVWNVTWTLLARWTPNYPTAIVDRWRVFLLRLFGAKIGKRCVVKSSAKIWQPRNLTMGDYATISHNVDCYNVAPIIIGDNVSVSQGVKLCTASHDISSPIMELTYKSITIGANAWVAGWSIILPGVTIGEGAVVAAGSVVTHDVAPWTVVGGNPAKFIKARELIGA